LAVKCLLQAGRTAASDAEHDTAEAKPFASSADPDDIIAARNRGFQMSDSIA